MAMSIKRHARMTLFQTALKLNHTGEFIVEPYWNIRTNKQLKSKKKKKTDYDGNCMGSYLVLDSLVGISLLMVKYL